MRVRRLALAAALLAPAACGPASAPAGKPFAGQPPDRCYALEYAGEGTAIFPVRIGFVGPRGWVVGVPSAEGRQYWPVFRGGGMSGPARGDSVDIGFSNGFSALMMRVRAEGDRFAGEAWFAAGGVGAKPPPRARVTGQRIPCDPNEVW